MDKDVLEYIINEMDQTDLQHICKVGNVKISGFRDVGKYPRVLIIPKLLKNKDQLFKTLKDLADDSEENTKFKGKDIQKIESSIDINNKEKTIHQIIYLITRNRVECTNLANRIVNQIKNKNNIQDYIRIDKEEKNKETGTLTKNHKGDYNMINTEKDIGKYIVTVKCENYNFWNIYPLYSLEGGKINNIHKSNYPDYGNVNINPYLEFSKKNYDNISPLWICKFNESELEEIEYKSKVRGEGKTKFKIDGDKLINNHRIYDINKEGIYEIGDLIEEYVNLEEVIYNNDKIEIKSKPIKEKVYIKDSDYIYGPFEYKENHKGGGYYINKSSNDYIVERYSINDNKECINISEIELTNDYISYNVKIVYFHDTGKLLSETLDIINNEELLKKVKEIISIKNTNYSRKEIQEIRSNIKVIIDNSLSEVRINRIKKLIKNTEMTDEFVGKDLIEIIGLLLENEEKRNIITNKILEKPENLRKLQNVEIVQSNIENKKEELKKLQEEINGRKRALEQINIKNESFTNKNINELIDKSNKDMQQMERRKEQMEEDIENISKKYELCEEIDVLYKTINELKKKAKEAEDDYNVFTRKSQSRKNQAEKIEEEIKLKLKNATSLSQYSDIAFDGMIANEMLESASKWIKGKGIEDFQRSIGSKDNFEKSIEVKSFKQNNVIDYIYNKVKQSRDYSRNDVINIMICLTQGFLTVFAGEPGVGKTSLCNIIANVLGITNKNNDYNRFIEISVEKGWTSKRDLIGYYNPLTKSFDKNNSSLFKTFNILDLEYKKGINDFPYYVLLDEANLSSMEHYWADFMSVCDLDKENRKINLGEDYIYYIPKTLRFLATINYDHTTETLSPRLIDRAWIILLESNNLEIEDYDLSLVCEQKEQSNDGIIMFEDIKSCFSYSSYDNSDEETISPIYEELKTIYKMFSENNMYISQRVDNMIKKYLKVGCNLFKDTNSTSHEFVALDYVIAQKMLPKINGYGDDYKEFLESLEKEFNEKNMMKCKKIVENIIEKGNSNMQYYQFFV